MNNKFIKSSLIKILIARTLGSKGLGLYMLILPTFMLLINISQLGFPLSLSKLVGEEKNNNKRLYLSVLPIILIINLIIMLTIIILSPFISNILLHSKDSYLSILTISFVIPFTSISSICRSYFFGKNKMFPHIISNITEDIVRLLIIYFGINHFIKLGIPLTVAFLVGTNIISELSSTIILIIFLPKNISFKRTDFIPSKLYIKENLKISIPTTSSRIIGSIAYFLEPIILTHSLLSIGYSSKYILKEYGIISGYVIPLILLPSFFTSAISQALLPTLSKAYQRKDKKVITKNLSLSIILSLIISLISTIILICFPSFLLQLIYHTNEGITYIKFLAPITILEYLEYPLSVTLDSFGKSKDNLLVALISLLLRISLLYILSYLRIGLYSLIITISINILITFILLLKKVRKHINNL